ncbi:MULTISPECIES: DUF1501 domain-containing protein [Pseudomonas]|uniref:DUF1501 domain-containing protein n=1 Tax=Pseudomonas TaxID=286 RepID=UPI000DA708D7|nr:MULTISPECIES: DUF1501 domain-containing protein [Pseudomonas]MDW3711398.1 DUF1501 domain-containing protein [Pseudomonas sp. 2023EL-01195]PZE12841.1 hypothetical protein DMX10_13635 [Pseudomonas sp. 57B-090624]
MISRRQLLIHAALLGVAGALPLRLAAAPGDARLLVVILRGGMDSLGVLVPHADDRYHDLRRELAGGAPGLLELDATFALHNALGPLQPLWRSGELLLLPACATPYRERSHFDAQDVLENGGDKAHGLDSGWLNRTLGALPGAHAMALGASMPLLLRGPARAGSWSPSTLPGVDEDFLQRVMAMYQEDTLLAGTLDDAGPMGGMEGGRGPQAFVALCRQAAHFMTGEARLGSLDLNGWDTHVNQNRRLATQLELLAKGLLAFREDMGAHWRNTAVLVVTEFGRTARGNGSGGTDHGTASLAMLLGGGLKGGRWLGDWPGLARLYQDRDLPPANDLRGLIHAVLEQHLGLPDALIAERILPGSRALGGLGRLFA